MFTKQIHLGQRGVDFGANREQHAIYTCESTPSQRLQGQNDMGYGIKFADSIATCCIESLHQLWLNTGVYEIRDLYLLVLGMFCFEHRMQADNTITFIGKIRMVKSLKLCMPDDAYDANSMLHNVMQAINILQRLSNNWQYRAQVKQAEFDEKEFFDNNKDDFLADLLPFKDHPLFTGATDELKKKILTCGWLAYNEKTIDIEAEIITPACMSIIHGEFPGLQKIMSTIASQTLVDEAYHVLLVNTGNQLTRQRRELLSLTFPESNLVAKMRNYQQQHSEKWQRTLILLATAIVSEIFISDYLKLLSHEMSIQPLNRLIVDIHRRDELLHSSIFKNIAKCIYTSLSIKKREFFLQVLPLPIRWFANLELDVWYSILQQIEFENTHILINDCRSMNEENLARIDYSGLINLAKELESSHTRIGMDSFYSEGLIA